jgi:hypothetical protein
VRKDYLKLPPFLQLRRISVGTYQARHQFLNNHRSSRRLAKAQQSRPRPSGAVGLQCSRFLSFGRTKRCSLFGVALAVLFDTCVNANGLLQASMLQSCRRSRSNCDAKHRLKSFASMFLRAVGISDYSLKVFDSECCRSAHQRAARKLRSMCQTRSYELAKPATWMN